MSELDTGDGRLDIVAIGSSAGGLHALTAVLSGFPPDLPASILIVQHLDPRYPSHFAEILARSASIPIVQAADGDRIDQCRAYIAPPDRHMLVERDRIRLTTSELVHFVRPSVDLLFESVAAAYGARAIGVILTGSGTDGAMGIRAIKERNGFTIAQDPASAESTGMPNSAVATGMIDLVVPLEQIGPAIVGIVNQEKYDVADE